MGEFVCRVADGEGRVFSHVEAAASMDEARQKLSDRGLYVYSVESRGGILAGLLAPSRTRQIGGSEFLILNQQFNTLIKAGLPILRALDLLATRASSPKLRPVITEIRDHVREGKSLSEAVADAGGIVDYKMQEDIRREAAVILRAAWGEGRNAALSVLHPEVPDTPYWSEIEAIRNLTPPY